MAYTLNDCIVMEELIEKIISTDMAIKSKHGYIYEVRNIYKGESNKFINNENTFIVDEQLFEIDVEDILSKEQDLLVKGDQIAFRIIEEINKTIENLIDHSASRLGIKELKGCVKVVYGDVIVIKEQKVYFKFGAGLLEKKQKFTGGFISKSEGERLSGLVNNLFNVTPNEKVVNVLKDKIVIPQSTIENLPEFIKQLSEKIDRRGE